MPTATVALVPGVNFNKTPSLNEAAYQSTNLIRWDPGSGLPQKIGGWSKFYAFPETSIVTTLHAWEDLSGVLHLGVGCKDSLDVITNGVLNPITPELITTNPAVNFTTTNGSAVVTIIDVGSNTTTLDVIILNTPVSIGGIVLMGAYPITQSNTVDSYNITAAAKATSSVPNGGAVPVLATTSGSPAVVVTLNNHGYSVGSTFPVTLPTTVGGVTLSGFYTVSAVADANNFTINATNQASSTTSASMNGGNAQILYYITPGPSALGVGYGDGGYGDGGYGTGVPLPPFSGTPISVDDYTLDNWGGYIVACPNDGPIFVWQPQSGYYAAQMIAAAPTKNTGVFVTMPAQIMVAYGSSVLGVKDPLLLNWSTAGDYTVWTAAVSNQAGSYRIPRGSAIVGAMQGPQYSIIWTDLDLWSMSYIGPPFIFSFSEIATGCGLIAKFAAVALGTTVYWMSQKQFFALPAGGAVTPVPCSVWDFVYQNLDTANLESIRAAANSQFGEVTWYFPVIGGDGQNSAYVKFTQQFSAWDVGFLSRSAWIDQSVLGPPIGADPESLFIYQHETSNDADGLAMTPSFTTGYWALSDGQDMIYCDLAMPDFKFGMYGGSQNATVQLSFSYAAYAESTVYTTPTYTMQSGTPSFLNIRLRGRLVSLTVQSSDLGTFWRLGGLRVRTAPDGRL